MRSDGFGGGRRRDDRGRGRGYEHDDRFDDKKEGRERPAGKGKGDKGRRKGGGKGDGGGGKDKGPPPSAEDLDAGLDDYFNVKKDDGKAADAVADPDEPAAEAEA